MADKKLSDLDAQTGANLVSTDIMEVADLDASPASRKVTLAELMHAYTVVITTALAGAGVHATQDKIPIHDNGVAKHILVTELQIAMAALATAITTGFHATEDTLLYDDNGAAKKITIPNLLAALVTLNTTALAAASIAGVDELIIADGGAAAGTPKSVTVTALISAVALLGFTLADIPEYADQAAAATGLTGTGRLWRQATTGLLGVTIS